MILEGTDAINAWRWPFFAPSEYECHGSVCCGHSLVINTEHLDRMHALRVEFGHPLVIVSGYRCPEYNAVVSRTGRHGPHTEGASDVAIAGELAHRLLTLALKHGFTGIGIKQHGPVNARFLHLDNLTGPGYPRPRIWSY